MINIRKYKTIKSVARILEQEIRIWQDVAETNACENTPSLVHPLNVPVTSSVLV